MIHTTLIICLLNMKLPSAASKLSLAQRPEFGETTGLDPPKGKLMCKNDSSPILWRVMCLTMSWFYAVARQ